MTYKLEKILEDQTIMKAELRTLKEGFIPIKDSIAALEIGQHKLEMANAANDSKVEVLRNEIAKQYIDLGKKLEPLPDIQIFVSNVKFGAWVAGFIIAAGFTFVAGVSKVLLDMNAVLNLLAGG